MKKLSMLAGALSLLSSIAGLAPARAEQRLRVQVDQRGDFALIGNTLGWDCGALAALPVVGVITGVTSPTNCGLTTSADSSPDLFWRSDDPAVGQATASPVASAGQARSSALLQLPVGALVTHAYLYWGGRRASSAPDATVVFERPGVFTQSVDATASYTLPLSLAQGPGYVYQSVADVTNLVRTNNSGVYRVSGVDSDTFVGVSVDVLFAGWSLVVLYQLDTDPPRNLAVFDGFDGVDGDASSAVTLAGFLVPSAGFDAKLGAIVYEGDNAFSGDSLRFGTKPLDDADRLTDGQNPVDNFFNGTRSRLGVPVSVAGDLPQLAGTAGTMAGLDLDIVDVTGRMTGGQTSVDLEATSSLDFYYLGAFITSVSTFRPDFITSTKKVRDVNGGAIQVGDELEYSIVVSNTGNDASLNTIVVDPLPLGVSYVPGSTSVVTGPNMGAKTDASGDDQASYDAAMRSLTLNVGRGATATTGGALSVGESSGFVFRVKVDGGTKGVISNQARIAASGERGAPSSTTLTDGNAEAPGNPPTDITTGPCSSSMECGNDKPVCDPSTGTCVGCTEDRQCMGAQTKCDLATRTCVCAGAPRSCLDGDKDDLPDPDEETIGTDPMDADSDDDGVLDGREPKPGTDSDGDGKVNARDSDSDGDGLFDGTELGLGCGGPGTDATRQQCRADGDMGKTVTDPLDADSDDGTVSDGQEDTDLDGAQDSGERDPTAGHGADDKTQDTDSDGLSDGKEDDLGTDPMDADSDDDGVRDGDEPELDQDTDRDGVINVLDPDSDGDGIFDGTELGRGCDDTATDRNRKRCVPDADMGQTTTSPIDADTDAGGVADGVEDGNKDGDIDAGETDPRSSCDDHGSFNCDDRLQSLAGGGGCRVAAPSMADEGGLLCAWTLLGLLWSVRRARNAARRAAV